MADSYRRTIRAGLMALAAGLSACAQTAAPPPAHTAEAASRPSVGAVERLAPGADEVFAEDARVERLTGDLFVWSEGPVWMAARETLLFTDVPGNTLYSWSESDGLRVVLDPSGLAGEVPDTIREAGANGLIADGPGAVLMGDTGNRTVARVDLRTGERRVLTGAYRGEPYNSPNDLVRAADGGVYFTDPPYGLAGGDASPLKRQDANGVYRLAPDGEVARIEDGLTRPNGVGLSPDGRTLYVAQSDPEAAHLYAYALGADGLPTARRLLADFTPLVRAGEPGLPDGMAVDRAGRIFLAGPVGVHVLTPEGERLALVRTGTAAANAALTDDGRMLYVTSGAFLARVPLLGD